MHLRPSSSPEQISAILREGVVDIEKIVYDPAAAVRVRGVEYAPVDSYPSFEEAADDLHRQITALANNPPGEPVVVRSTPGLGKTESSNHVTRILSVSGKRVAIGLPTREMARQVADRLTTSQSGQKVILLEGRHPGYNRTVMDEEGRPTTVEVKANCNRYDAVERAARKGYAAGAYVCPRCPYWPNAKKNDSERVGYGGCCAYYEALARAQRRIPDEAQEGVWPAAIVSSHSGLVAHVFNGSVEVDWVILDEDCSNALRTTHTWDRDELERGCETIPALKANRSLLAETINISQRIIDRFYMSAKRQAKVHPALHHLSPEEMRELCTDMASARFKSEWTLSGMALRRFLLAAARALGQDDLKAVLGRAADSKAWVDRGGLYDADDAEIEDLPHHLEPELARELHKVVLEAEEGRESAYAVSLRGSKKEGWRFVLDRLDPIEYDGQVVLLDAYADDELTRRYFGLASPPLTIDARCRCRENVTIKHYEIKTTRKVLDDLESRSALYDRFILPELERHRGKKILFYTAKRYAEWLRKRVAAEYVDHDAIAVKYWWQDRGDDSYGDYDVLIMFGTPIPNIIGERHTANALFSGEESLSWHSDVNGPVDRRVKAAEEAKRDKELYQGAFRLRPASAEGKEQTIILLTEMQLPVLREMPGAAEVHRPKPTLDTDWIAEKMSKTMSWLGGCWSTAFSAFQYGLEGKFVKWARKALRAPSGKPPRLFLPYETILARWKRLRSIPERRREHDAMVKAFGPPTDYIRTRAGSIPVWGNRYSAFRIIQALETTTRQPGEDVVDCLCDFVKVGNEAPIVAMASPLLQVMGWRPTERGPP